MRSETQHREDPFSGGKAVAGIIAFLAKSLSVSVEVFLHSGFGVRYFDGAAAAVFLIAFIFPVFGNGDDPETMLWFLAAYWASLIWHRLAAAWRRRRDGFQHSHYSGYPRLMRLPVFRMMKESVFKTIVEPPLVFFGGVFLMPLSETLGTYCVIASFGMVVNAAFRNAFQRVRMLDMRDAYIEQKYIAERFRENEE
jgi:hypothetical protein